MTKAGSNDKKKAALMQGSGARIIGIGACVPSKVLTNLDLEKMVDTSDEWITTRSGIKERRIADDNITTSDMAAEAAIKALKNAQMSPKELDLIIVATVTPDMLFPSTACLVQKKIGASNAAAFDISAACSGFVYGMITAFHFIRAGHWKKILVIGAEMLSKITDWTDRSTCVLFGDGAGAVVLEKGNGSTELIYAFLGSEGQFADMLEMPAGGTRMPTTHETVDKHLHCIKMKGNELFKWAVNKMKFLVEDVLEQTALTPDQISLIIPHQVNIRIIEAAIKKVDIPMTKVVINLDKYGNTSAASIPIAIDEAYRDGRLKAGDVVLLVAFGSGLTSASCLLRW